MLKKPSGRWKSLALAVLLALSSAAACAGEQPGETPAVSRWMEFAAAERTDWFERRPDAARADAVTALAMFEAANAIEQRYPSYLGLGPAHGDIPAPEAAAVAAARALSLLYPDKKEIFEAALEEAFPVADSRAETLGDAAARAAFERGAALSDRPQEPYRTSAPAGVYVPTETLTAISPFDLTLQPWALDAVDEARPAPAPSLKSKTYTQSLIEVADYGGKESSKRTQEQSETAHFWFFIDMNPVLRQIALRPGRSVSRNARLYAMFYMATDDAWTASADGKAYYQLWRPVTAIRQADRDANPATTRVSNWSAFMPTPAHPEYPCAHCVQASAQAVVIASDIDNPGETFEFKSSAIPDAPPRQVSLSGYVEQTALSRIYAGAHYRFSNDAGIETGRKVGAKILERWPER